jgi:cytochrome d ubiquinol oxidase subunit I
MDPTLLARLQFAITTVYHFFFVPLTLGLAILVAVMETFYVRTGQEIYKRMTKFWGKLFLINFAIGVVTGIVQEFQFGMNWSDYSRYVGDIFGAPLAIEALLAFFLESTFLGIWIFGWNKLSKKVHLLTIWLVAIGSNISALWILIANSWMQNPVGYTIVDGRAQMTSFASVISNPNIFYQFPHVLFSGLTTGAFFILGISAYHLVRKQEVEFFKRSFQMAAITGVIFAALVGLNGHAQTQYIIKTQPMKLAAAEALWNTEDPASFSLFTIGDMENRRDVFAIRIPRLLSFLAYNQFSGEVKGINDLQAEYEAQYGPGNYVPPAIIPYWAFRFMVGSGGLMIVLALLGLYLYYWKKLDRFPWALKILTWGLLIPYLANSSGWLLTEVGRYPWVVYGLMKIEEAASPNVTAGMLWTSLVGYVLVYGLLIAATVYLLMKFAKAGPSATDESPLTGEQPADSLPSLVN